MKITVEVPKDVANRMLAERLAQSTIDRVCTEALRKALRTVETIRGTVTLPQKTTAGQAPVYKFDWPEDYGPTPCPYCGTEIYGTACDIDSGLRKHLEVCDEYQAEDEL